MPLGVKKTDAYEPISFRFENSDQLILYTDGIIEALQEWSDVDPVEALLDCLDGKEKSSDEVVKHIFNKAEMKEGEKDDMTVLSMKLTATKEKNSGYRKSKWLQRNLDEIYRLNSVIEEAVGLSDTMFRVAAIEAFTNIVKHSDESANALKVHTDVDESNRTMIYFLYDGPFFKPESIKLPDCEKQNNGFGLYLVEKICHKVEYFRTADGMNCICLTAREK